MLDSESAEPVSSTFGNNGVENDGITDPVTFFLATGYLNSYYFKCYNTDTDSEIWQVTIYPT